MKNIILSVFSFLLLLAAFLACEKSDKHVSKPDFLIDAVNLAKQTGGFYSKVGQVDITSKESAGQTEVTIELHDNSIRPYRIRLYLNENAQLPALKSGRYEVLFVGSALIINDPMTSEKREFIVRNESLKLMQEKLPEGYTSSDAIEAVGIAVYGNHENASGRTSVVPVCAKAGGPGSTSCSNTCCSVSCSSGFYASCNADCICIKNSAN